CSKFLREHIDDGSLIQVITHNDADGLAAGAIMQKTLMREDCGVQTRCLKQLEREIVKELSKEDKDVFIFSDCGSGQLDSIKEHLLEKTGVFVLDHHQPKEIEDDNLVHINPHNFGIDGVRDVSGAGMVYLFSKALNPDNTKLAHLAIIGAAGDIQDPEGKMTGLNVGIAEDGKKAGVLSVEKDLRIWGRQTRPLFKALSYTNEPFLPGLSGNESACIQFLSDLDIPVKREDGEMTRLVDLSQDEKKRLSNALILKMLEYGASTKKAESIIGEVYTIIDEEERTALRDAREYVTVLNACGRYEKYGIGIAICLGERGSLYEEGLNLLVEHKKYLSTCYGWVYQNSDAVEDREVLYTFHVHNEVDENVIGTVATMVINSGVFKPVKPVIAFVETRDGGIKASSRGTGELIRDGLNLGDVMQYAAEKVGGEGGGHNIAAGAQMELGKEEEFLKHAVEMIKDQLYKDKTDTVVKQ
ncbi:MAG: DHH family phosphoesterase, partial [Candidatus Hydrothermarchaeales archaeon]